MGGGVREEDSTGGEESGLAREARDHTAAEAENVVETLTDTDGVTRLRASGETVRIHTVILE